jgi:SAM-dependent methyltransferase
MSLSKSPPVFVREDGSPPGSLPESIMALGALAERIAAATQVDLAAVLVRLRAECVSLGANVRRDLAARKISPHVWSQSLIEFYRDTDAFFYELVVWNRTREKTRQREWIVRFIENHWQRPVSVLVYGDGLGFDGAVLQRAGHRVAGFEVSSKYGAFARKLFADLGVAVEWIDHEEGLRDRLFDVIVCLDVLEHVPDPPALAKDLADHLLPEGCLLVHAPFWLVDDATQTHLLSNRTYSGDWRRLYAPAGLIPVAARWMWNPVALARQTERCRHFGWGGLFRVSLSRWFLVMARFVPLPFNIGARAMLRADVHRGGASFPVAADASSSGGAA